MTADELMADTLSDLGGEEALSTLERAYVRRIVDVDTSVRLLIHHLATHGLTTPGGRVRDAYDKLLAGITLFDRLSQRLGFKFEELIGVRPVEVPPMRQGEHREDHALRVKRHLVVLEREIHQRLDHLRVRRKSRANANEWFRFDEALIHALFDDGWVVARARVTPGLGTRFGRGFWAAPV